MRYTRRFMLIITIYGLYDQNLQIGSLWSRFVFLFLNFIFRNYVFVGLFCDRFLACDTVFVAYRIIRKYFCVFIHKFFHTIFYKYLQGSVSKAWCESVSRRKRVHIKLLRRDFENLREIRNGKVRGWKNKDLCVLSDRIWEKHHSKRNRCRKNRRIHNHRIQIINSVKIK